MRLVKIVTPDSGTSMGTKVLDAETGAEVKGVEQITVAIKAGDLVRADLRLQMLQFEGHANARMGVADPRTGTFRPVSKIVFADDGEELTL